MTDSKEKQSEAIFGKNWENETDANELLAKIRTFYKSLSTELGKVIVGQEQVIDLIIISILCKGHTLLEGVPGLGKTLMFKTLSKVMDLNFSHVQFTPDLMPSDITGTEIIQSNPETQHREMKFLKGPIFCNFLLGDEINRASPRTQSALLQAMQDKEVSVGNHTYKLDEPFFVLATQNPIDQEGVYPLPEAQLDRFMFNVWIDYPKREEEIQIVQRYSQNETPTVNSLVAKEDLLHMQMIARAMLASESLLWYAVDFVTATRPSKDNPYTIIRDWVQWGAGPRASIQLILAAKARALLKGRLCASVEDVRAVADPVLRHRIKLNFTAEAEGVKTGDVIKKLIELIPDPKKNK